MVCHSVRHRGPKTGRGAGRTSVPSSRRSPTVEQNGQLHHGFVGGRPRLVRRGLPHLEFDPATKVTVQMIRDTIHPEDLPTFDAVIARGMTGTDVDFVFRIVTARGAIKHVRGMARVM